MSVGTVVSRITHDNIVASIEYMEPAYRSETNFFGELVLRAVTPESYVARIFLFTGFSCPDVALVKSFGNMDRAEEWILDEISMPESLFYLKYAKCS